MLTDEDLVARLTLTEDSFVERKSKNDKGGWLRTVVAFANSTPIGYPAVLFIGVNDVGEIADDVNVQNVMKSFSDFIEDHVWPPVYTLPRTLTHNVKSCVAVIVPGSSERPHFTGKSYVRLGTQTKDASESQFAELIAQRNSKTREIQKWIGKEITFVRLDARSSDGGYSQKPPNGRVSVKECNAHWATFEFARTPEVILQSFSITRLEIEFDHSKNILSIRLYPDR